MVSWSTDTINERECFSYWRDVVCDAIFNISPEAPPERFSARITARSSGPLRFATCESTSYEIIRTARDIDRAPSDHYTIYLQLRGQTLINQGNESVAFNRNDFVLSDCRRPFRATLSNDGYRAIAVVPRALVNSRAPWLRRRPIMVRLVSNDLSEKESSVLTENLCNLLALASAADTPPNRVQAELQLEALLAYCQQNFHRLELSPHSIAEHFGISVRTLHLRFEKLGQSFGRWLLETRLDACCKALRDPRQRTRRISEIAYSCGFNDLSHFNKAFRARFKMSPGEWRFETLM